MGSTAFSRTVLKRLIAFGLAGQLYVAFVDYGTVQYSRTGPLEPHPKYDTADELRVRA